MIYLDNAATTRICSEALEAINKYYNEQYFNPSAVYKGAIDVKNAMDKARETIAKCLYVDKQNVFFTSGGTEGDNMAINGSVTHKSIGRVLVGSCEHPAVYKTCMALKEQGYDVVEVPCKIDGSIDVETYKKLIDDGKVGFASIMHVNNETGAINDIVTLARLLKAKNPQAIFHSDGVQAFMKVPVNLKNSQVDLYSFSAHKINGSKGVGAIYVKNPSKLKATQTGGGQEKNLRSGTENTAGIIAFGEAVNHWKTNRKEYLARFEKFRAYIIDKLSTLDNVWYNTDVNISCPHVLSLNIGEIKGEVLLHMLEGDGIYIGRGSACSTKDALPQALKALNVSGEGTIRISFGMYNTMEEIEIFTEKLIAHTVSLRNVMRKK